MSRRLRRLLDRLRDWWHGEPGRHAAPRAYDYFDEPEPATSPIPIVAVQLREREQPDDSWTADALRRAMAPRLYASPDLYWGERYRDFFSWAARQTALRNEHRIEMGLGEAPVPALPAVKKLVAA